MVSKRVTYALIATAAIGAGCGVVYYIKKRAVPEGETKVSIELEKTHITWLKEKAATYTGGNVNKAIQTVIAYCVKKCESQAGVEEIFKKIRCNSCGGKDKAELSTSLIDEQVQFATEAMSTHSVDSFDKVIRIMFEYAINDVDVSLIFSL